MSKKWTKEKKLAFKEFKEIKYKGYYAISDLKLALIIPDPFGFHDNEYYKKRYQDEITGYVNTINTATKKLTELNNQFNFLSNEQLASEIEHINEKEILNRYNKYISKIL